MSAAQLAGLIVSLGSVIVNVATANEAKETIAASGVILDGLSVSKTGAIERTARVR